MCNARLCISVDKAVRYAVDQNVPTGFQERVEDRHGAEVFQYSEYSNTSEYFSKSNHEKTRHPEITSIQKVFRTRQLIYEYSQLVIMNTCEYF